MPVTVTETECHWAMLGYLGAVFLGPVAPWLVWLAEGRRSSYVRQHINQTLNLTLTCALYALSALIVAGLLALDTPVAALAIMGPVVAAGWLVALVYLVRGATAAARGTYRTFPTWICSPLVGH
jgi:uncharacterized Tic20 family protein